MIIVGAGMAGLLAGHMFRRHTPRIMEAQPSLPNNHEALLRFRGNRVAEATGTTFKKVLVRKNIVWKGEYHQPNIFFSNMYSRKVIGEVRDRSIWNLDPVERYVAPGNFIEQMAGPLSINYGEPLKNIQQITGASRFAPVISTVPMPVLMDIVGWPDKPKFSSLPIWSVQLEVLSPSVDVYQTIYYPDPEVKYYRCSITGNRLIMEYCHEPTDFEADLQSVMMDFALEPAIVSGEPKPKEHKFGKIAPISDEVRKEFIYTMTREYGIYSLGRFAIWKQVLLDDVVKDCEVIASLIAAEGKRSAYHQSLAAAGQRKH